MNMSTSCSKSVLPAYISILERLKTEAESELSSVGGIHE